MTEWLTPEDQLMHMEAGERTLEESFLRFHKDNPQVYRAIVRLARRWARSRPGEPCGIGMLFETARWHLGVRGTGEAIALNNNYRAFYARLIMSRERDLEGIFLTRKQRRRAARIRDAA